MPKEKINHPGWYKTQLDAMPGDVLESDATAVATTDPALSVRWHRNGDTNMPGHVQIAFETYPAAPWSEFATADCWPTREPDEVFSPVLTRSEINDLIRVLRRARDQAYGRDE